MNKKIVLLFTTLFILLLSSGCKKKNDKSYKRKDDFIYFGTYPQTLVSDGKIIDKLNNKSGSLPTKEASHNWSSYNYYSNSNVENFMFYQDVDLNDDKTFTIKTVDGQVVTTQIDSWTTDLSNGTYTIKMGNEEVTGTIAQWQLDTTN